MDDAGCFIGTGCSCWVLGTVRYWDWVLPSLPRHDADIGQVAVSFGIVEPVADDKFVRDFEADVIPMHWHLAARGLVEKSCNLQLSGLMREQQLFKT